tara:strand:- start:1280 stop:2308 length:1029 start_codon:yes stop_codon:yes gene_type:complete
MVTIFLFTTFAKSFSEENLFTINNIEVKGAVDLNFSREKYLDIAFLNSFDSLMKKILLSRDLNKIDNIKLKQIKNLIYSFQILDERYTKNEYFLKVRIVYNDTRVKKYLRNKNISFSQPANISALFYPVFFINGEFQNFNESFFYKKWSEVSIENEIINFILPLEDLEDISKIIEKKENIEDLDIDYLVNKYDIKNYIFALIEFYNEKLKIHIKTNFNNRKTNKNILYSIKDINDAAALSLISKDLKLNITDLWKEENLVNLLMPLSIKLKFKHKNIRNFENVKKTFESIDIIDNYIIEEFNTNNSFFKIYYYGDPKKLELKLSKFGYNLINEQGTWQVKLK